MCGCNTTPVRVTPVGSKAPKSTRPARTEPIKKITVAPRTSTKKIVVRSK